VRCGATDLPFRAAAIESSGYVDFRTRVEGSAAFTISLL
jgi:hypothetical protein